uniref:Ycf45 n=1 Tax=Vacuolaria virescens TaxID=44451 RepID=UPI00211537C3|nr:Ycf45 [Vacuolaria virescens]UTE94738.1 Ycf45 [Vacuolaria virescens]
MFIEEDLNQLIEILPNFLKLSLKNNSNRFNLIEIVMDLGRRPEGRFLNGSEYLSQRIISSQDLDFCTKKLKNFSNDNRSGIEKTLHRVSCIRNRKGNIIGLSCRVGRALFGTISIVRDLLESSESILILGKPGVGKTTTIREVARVLSDELEKRVVIVDTSNEIGGNSDIPHSGIGKARRMQVSKSELQHNVMVEAVENHTPEVIIVDEIGSELEVLAARTIAERGVQLIGTVHGNCLENLIKNPILTDIVGGITNVTLSDEEAKRRKTQKNILERKASPAFQIAIEINQKTKWFIHENISQSVDFLLQKQNPFLQSRILEGNNKVFIYYELFQANNTKKSSLQISEKNNILEVDNEFITYSKKIQKKIHIYPYLVSINKVQQVSKSFCFNAFFTKNIYKATAILALKSYVIENKKLLEIAKIRRIPIYTIKKNTETEIAKIIHQIMK